ncbi:trypsin-like peptidase domain-containing protein [Ramlibacter terrae]|uniref:Trypsin-like peptidase domain-containing protein n=1 Tax=Ramlibacter terrae TaxID=2732511 RepID=A0ABX6P6C9_9BURK|nr:trypsin-like peptidase domain-containing protein [Ramlibacter terrae]
MIEPLLLACTRVSTFNGERLLTAASGFLFERGARLFFVTNRHVLIDPPNGHHPDRIDLAVHTDAVDLTRFAVVSVPLYADGKGRWRQAEDSGGDVDVAAIELDRAALPKSVVVRAFTLDHLQGPLDEIGIGTPLLVVGFPLGFYDTVHNLPVARQAAVASAFGVRFREKGYFLTDARTHRGTSGAPVVMRDAGGDPKLPRKLLGIHAARIDMRTREEGVDESLGLNSAWYADILRTLTEDAKPAAAPAPRR